MNFNNHFRVKYLTILLILFVGASACNTQNIENPLQEHIPTEIVSDTISNFNTESALFLSALQELPTNQEPLLIQKGSPLAQDSMKNLDSNWINFGSLKSACINNIEAVKWEQTGNNYTCFGRLRECPYFFLVIQATDMPQKPFFLMGYNAVSKEITSCLLLCVQTDKEEISSMINTDGSIQVTVSQVGTEKQTTHFYLPEKDGKITKI